MADGGGGGGGGTSAWVLKWNLRSLLNGSRSTSRAGTALDNDNARHASSCDLNTAHTLSPSRSVHIETGITSADSGGCAKLTTLERVARKSWRQHPLEEEGMRRDWHASYSYSYYISHFPFPSHLANLNPCPHKLRLPVM